MSKKGTPNSRIGKGQCSQNMRSLGVFFLTRNQMVVLPSDDFLEELQRRDVLAAAGVAASQAEGKLLRSKTCFAGHRV